MRNRFRWSSGVAIVALVAVVATAVGVAYALDQKVLGKQLQVKDPKPNPGGDPLKRKVVDQAKEKPSDNTIVGDPTVNGAVLTISVTGATSTSQVFNLPQGIDPSSGKPFWATSGSTGFKYKDKDGTNSPVKTAQIKLSGGGTFQIKAVALGKNGPINVLPPNPGLGGCALFEINGGDRYHMLFVLGTVKKDDIKTFMIKDPAAEGFCPGVPLVTTTTSTSTSTTTSTSSSTTTTAPLADHDLHVDVHDDVDVDLDVHVHQHFVDDEHDGAAAAHDLHVDDDLDVDQHLDFHVHLDDVNDVDDHRWWRDEAQDDDQPGGTTSCGGPAFVPVGRSADQRRAAGFEQRADRGRAARQGLPLFRRREQRQRSGRADPVGSDYVLRHRLTGGIGPDHRSEQRHGREAPEQLLEPGRPHEGLRGRNALQRRLHDRRELRRDTVRVSVGGQLLLRTAAPARQPDQPCSVHVRREPVRHGAERYDRHGRQRRGEPERRPAVARVSRRDLGAR